MYVCVRVCRLAEETLQERQQLALLLVAAAARATRWKALYKVRITCEE
jgi:hypothetical protein